MAYKRGLGLALLLICGTANAAPVTPQSTAARPAAKKDISGPALDAKPPAEALKLANWEELFAELMKQDAYFTAMAAAQRLMVVLPDVAAQELAYKTMIALSDNGYPLPIRQSFLTATLEPDVDTDFGQEYYFYKALSNQDKGIKRWSDYYFRRLGDMSNTENLPDKFLQYQALQAYAAKDLKKARELFLKLLQTRKVPLPSAYVAKVARTVARMYFEEKNYEASLDIYQNLLLQMPYVTYSDWLEAAWDLYYLKRYSEALGFLYNLESPLARKAVHLEKYVLRGLIYQGLCDRSRMNGLLAEFEKRFKNTVLKIKTGEPLTKIPDLKKIRLLKHSQYSEVLTVANSVKEEEERVISSSGGTVRNLARYVYATESELLVPRMFKLESKALDAAAEELLLAYESIRFLNFEIEKAMVDPSRIFAKKKLEEEKTGITENALHQFELSWPQGGDFWRDERLKYRVSVENLCNK